MDDFSAGEGKEGASLAESDDHVGLSHKIIEPFHEVFGDEVGPAVLVVWILHDWSKHLIAYGVHVFEDVLGDLQEDDVVLEVLFLEFLAADSQDDEAWI